MHTPGEDRPGGAGRLLAGRYRVVRQLGRGGMGVVCSAHDEVLGREVAVKELRTFSDASPPELADLRRRMQREARAAARVRHRGVIAVHDIAEHEGRPVIVMELVDGPSLDDVLREGPLDAARAAAVGADVLDALAAAHRAGVLHRDVKPGNILLERGGRVVLTDFGIAAVEDPGDGASAGLTRSGELVGSLDYLAPERARGEDPGPASDVWSLGATLFAALEGASPFRRTSTWSTITAIVSEPLPEPRNAGPLGPALRALMDKDPARRPDATQAAALLRQVAAGHAPHAGVPDAGGPHAGDPASTMQLGTVREPRPSAGADRDTDRGTLATRNTPRPRRGAAVAAAVAAVLLVGAGVAWAAGALGPDQKQPRAAAGQPGRSAAPAGPEASRSANGPSDDPEEGRSSPGPSRSAGASESAAPGGDSDDAADGTGGGEAPADEGGRPTQGGDDPPGGTSSGGTGGGPGGGGPAPVCHPDGAGRFDCEVWRDAQSYDGAHRPVGTLRSGTNYFYCQQRTSHRETYGSWTNVWWAKTDDDSGNAGVWVSVVYIRGGDDDQPVPGLPAC